MHPGTTSTACNLFLEAIVISKTMSLLVSGCAPNRLHIHQLTSRVARFDLVVVKQQLVGNLLSAQGTLSKDESAYSESTRSDMSRE